MHTDFKRYLLLFAIPVCWCLLAFFMPVAVISHSFQATSRHPGESSTLTLYVRSFLPPKEVSPLDRLPSAGQDEPVDEAADSAPATAFGNSAAGHFAPVSFCRLSWAGPVWKQTVSIFPVSLDEKEATTVHAYGTKITLPPLNVTLPENLPAAAVKTTESSDDSSSTFRVWPWLLAMILAFIGLTIWEKRHRLTPRQRLRQLPIIVQALNEIPDILAEAKPPVTPTTNPEYFARLDAIRFSQKQPSMNAIRGLILQADKFLEPPIKTGAEK